MAAGLASALAGLAIPRITLKLDGRSLIPAGHAELAQADEAARRFGLRDAVVIGITDPETVIKPDVLGWVTTLSAELAGLPDIAPGSVKSLATLPRLFVERDRLALEPLLSGERPVDVELAARVARETAALGLADGVLVARDWRTTLIVAEVAPQADRYRLLSAVRGLLARPVPATARVSLTGTALAQAELGRACALDLLYLLPAVVALVAGALTLAFRHPVPALVSLSEIGVSLVATAGLMGLANEAIFTTTLVLPVVVLVIGVSDDVYALHRLTGILVADGTSGRRRSEVVFETFSEVGWPILLTAATTVTSLLTLLATDLTPQRTFGLYGAIAIVFSTLLTFTLVPALLMLLPLPRPPSPRQVAVPLPPDFWGLAWRAFEQVGPRRVLVAAAILAAVAAAIAPRLRIEDDWVSNLPRRSDIARGDRRLNKAMAGTTHVELMLDSGGADGLLDPAVFAYLGRLESALRATPGVGAASSPFTDVIRVQASLEGEPYSALRAALVSGADTLSTVEIESFLLLLASLRDSPLDERIDGGQRRARITAVMRDANYSRIEGAVAAARAVPAPPGLDPKRDLTPFGDGWVSYLAVRQLVTGQIASVGLALICDALLVFILMRSLRLTLIVLVPVGLAVLAVFAGLALAGHPLGIASSMFTAIALGIGIDYSTHLVAHFRVERERHGDARKAMQCAFDVTGRAIAKSTLAIAVGFAPLLGSSVLPNRELGLLIPVSLALCGAATLLLVPSMVLSGVAGPSSVRVSRRRLGPAVLRMKVSGR